MADSGYIQMNQDGLIDLGELDLSGFGPTWDANSVTSANALGNFFTDPRLPGVGAVAPVDGRQNLSDAFGAVLGMQQPIPDPGPSYDDARARRMAALEADLGLLDKTASAASAQIAAQRARSLDFGGLAIGNEANQLFGRAYDFAEGAVGQGRLSAEAKLRAQANAALDEILSGNYRAGYQGQVDQALAIPGQALTAAGQFNDVGKANQQADLSVLLEEAANRRAEMAAQQNQQALRFGEAGTDARFRADQGAQDARFRLGQIGENARLGVSQAGEDRRLYYNAVYSDLLAKNKWFRELPLEQQKLTLDALKAEMQSNTSIETQKIASGTSLTTTAQEIAARSSEGALDRAAQAAAESRRNAAQESLTRLQASLNNAKTPEEQRLLNLQIQGEQVKIDQAKAELDYINANGGRAPTAAELKTQEADKRTLSAVTPVIASWTPAKLNVGGAPTGAESTNDIAGNLAYGILSGSIGSADASGYVAKFAQAAADAQYPGRNVDRKKDFNATPRAAYQKSIQDALTAQVQQLSGAGLSPAGKEQLLTLYAARVEEAKKAAAAASAAVSGRVGAPSAPSTPDKTSATSVNGGLLSGVPMVGSPLSSLFKKLF